MLIVAATSAVLPDLAGRNQTFLLGSEGHSPAPWSTPLAGGAMPR